MSARHLVLVGLMGAGKTTVGERCARRLGRDFVDTDDVVAALAQMPVAEIFRQLVKQGYPGYVNLEYEIDGNDPLPGMKTSFAFMRKVAREVAGP